MPLRSFYVEWVVGRRSWVESIFLFRLPYFQPPTHDLRPPNRALLLFCNLLDWPSCTPKLHRSRERHEPIPCLAIRARATAQGVVSRAAAGGGHTDSGAFHPHRCPNRQRILQLV